jgi:hypothetical protein
MRIAAFIAGLCALSLFAADQPQTNTMPFFVPGLSVAGTGTVNRVPKWVDTAGTLADSVITENAGKVGIGTTTPGAQLHIFGAATADVFAGMGPDVKNGPAMNYGYAGTSFGRGAGFFNVRPDAGAIAPNPSLRFETVNQQRMIITNIGRVGIGTTAPNGRLAVQVEKAVVPIGGFVGVDGERALDIKGGDGSDGTTTPAGNGSDVRIVTGAGGFGSTIAGSGGALALISGAGGAGLTTFGGAGGTISLISGAGGSGSITPGLGGPITITAGIGGGGGTTFGGTGGTATISGGDGSASIGAGFGGTGGSVVIHAGAGGTGVVAGTPGSIQLQGNTTVTGNLTVNGTLTKTAGAFRIDHPLDPENKYLYHSFVESPDMKNMYDGVAELDANGEAVITLPDWFEALNKDFRYQLTCVGAYAPVYVASKIAQNRFTIGGGKPGMEVSWQVTGTRHDKAAIEHPIPVEEDKPERRR